MNSIYARIMTVALGLLNLGGCSALTSPELPAEYSDLGRIVIYSGFEQGLIDSYVKIFQQSHPNLIVDVKRFSNGDILEQVTEQAAKGEPIPDVLWGVTQSSLIPLRFNNILQPYRPSRLPPMYDANFIDSNDPPSWVGVNAIQSALCVNKQRLAAVGISSVPTEWTDLLDANRYRGRVAMPDPNKTATGFLTLIAWLNAFQDPKFSSKEDAGWDFVRGFKGNITYANGAPALTTQGNQACNAVTDPQQPAVVVGISLSHIASAAEDALIAEGKTDVLTISYPSNSGYDINANALIRKRKIKAVAKTFLDWAVSEPMLSEYAKVSSASPIVTPVQRPSSLPPHPKDLWVKGIDFEWVGSNHQRILTTWDAVIR